MESAGTCDDAAFPHKQLGNDKAGIYLTDADVTVIDHIMQHFCSLYNTGKIGQHTVSMMLENSAKLCLDPRDRFFALRSILGIDDIEEFQPDYSIEPTTLYRQFVS